MSCAFDTPDVDIYAVPLPDALPCGFDAAVGRHVADFALIAVPGKYLGYSVGEDVGIGVILCYDDAAGASRTAGTAASTGASRSTHTAGAA